MPKLFLKNYITNVFAWNTKRVEKLKTSIYKNQEKQYDSLLRTIIFITAFSLLVIGCAAGPSNNGSLNTQRLLVSSGFKYKTAESPEQLSELKALQQKTLFQHPHEGQDWYVYADEKGCNCLYYGDEENYQRFQQLIRSEKQATRRGFAVQTNQRTAVDHGVAPQINWDRWED